MNIPDSSTPRDAALASRYHLLLALPGPEEISGFQELVTEHGTPQQAGQWLATVEPALSVSSVEADARLAVVAATAELAGRAGGAVRDAARVVYSERVALW